MARRKRQAGFTLVELLITAAIMVILTVVAVPSYRLFVTKSVRTQAKGALLHVADRQEQFFLDNKTYADDLTDLGFGGNPYYIDRDGIEVSAESTNRAYRIALGDASAITFTLSAIPELQQAEADTACGTLSLSHTGQRNHSGPASDCW